jgi:hypothetical protein
MLSVPLPNATFQLNTRNVPEVGSVGELTFI